MDPNNNRSRPQRVISLWEVIIIIIIIIIIHRNFKPPFLKPVRGDEKDQNRTKPNLTSYPTLYILSSLLTTLTRGFPHIQNASVNAQQQQQQQQQTAIVKP